MHLSPPRLHAPVAVTLDHKAEIKRQLALRAAGTRTRAAAPFAIPLTTVSMSGNFDAYIEVQIAGSIQSTTLLFDSGNSMLIMPYWEEFEALPPQYFSAYQVLGSTPEPWGCPANVVRGPMYVIAADGSFYYLPDCVFYACTANNSSNERTANFGAGCIVPWTSSGWNTPPHCGGVVMQSPLSYQLACLYAEIDYAAADQVLTLEAAPLVAGGSWLNLYPSVPGGYAMLSILRNMEWMSLVPVALDIGATKTGWPGDVSSPIAMIDTGGGPAFLSDPNGYVYDKQWPDPVPNPAWTSSSTSCESTSDSISVGLASGAASYSYTIDPGLLPPSVQGLTLVMCKKNAYMMGENGMNIGGISALVNAILIDYAGGQVGLKPR